MADFLIATGPGVPILSLASCEKAKPAENHRFRYPCDDSLNSKNMVQLREDKLLHQFEDVFEGLGCLPGTYRIQC